MLSSKKGKWRRVRRKVVITSKNVSEHILCRCYNISLYKYDFFITHSRQQQPYVTIESTGVWKKMWQQPNHKIVAFRNASFKKHSQRIEWKLCNEFACDTICEYVLISLAFITNMKSPEKCYREAENEKQKKWWLKMMLQGFVCNAGLSEACSYYVLRAVFCIFIANPDIISHVFGNIRLFFM
jgi:hypothetical protein